MVKSVIRSVFKILYFFAAITPLILRAKIARAIGLLVYLLPTREKKIAFLHLKKFLPTQPTTTIVKKLYQNTVQNIFEVLDTSSIVNNPNLIDGGNLARMKEIVAENKGVVALTAHLSNWDLLAAFYIKNGIPLVAVGKETKNKHLQNELIELRNRYGIKIVWRSGMSANKEILQTLRRGGAIAAVIDQDTRVDSVFIPFFGIPAKTPVSLIELGKRLDTRFVSAFIVRTNLCTFKIFAEEIDSTLSAEEILKVYNSRLEQLIREYPDQWVWFHKRWRSYPDGRCLSSKEYLKWLSDS